MIEGKIIKLDQEIPPFAQMRGNLSEEGSKLLIFLKNGEGVPNLPIGIFARELSIQGQRFPGIAVIRALSIGFLLHGVGIAEQISQSPYRIREKYRPFLEGLQFRVHLTKLPTMIALATKYQLNNRGEATFDLFTPPEALEKRVWDVADIISARPLALPAFLRPLSGNVTTEEADKGLLLVDGSQNYLQKIKVSFGI